MYEDRIQRAVDLFLKGYNCSQSVVGAYADLYGFTPEQALRMSASFGGGIGRMRQTCGSACGMFLLAGLETGSVKEGDTAGKSYNYKIVQQLAEEFKKRNGALICSEILGLRKNQTISPEAEERTPSYYKTRPCTRVIENAARIYAEFLTELHKSGNPQAASSFGSSEI